MYKVVSAFYLGERTPEAFYNAGAEFPASKISDANRDILLGSKNETGKPLVKEITEVEVEATEVESAEAEPDYSTLKVDELRELLKERGVEFDAKAKKDELIALARS